MTSHNEVNHSESPGMGGLGVVMDMPPVIVNANDTIGGADDKEEDDKI